MAKKTVKKAKKSAPRTFNIVAKRVHKYSKKQKLNWSWQEAQKFTSKNIFKTFKGIPKSKLKFTEIDKLVSTVLQSGGTKKEVCASPFLIPSSDLEPVNWWGMPDVVNSFDPNLNIDIQFGSILTTGIVKKMTLPNMIDIREDFRKSKVSSDVTIIFRILTRPKKKDDGDACSYYLLVTIEGSNYDADTEESEIESFVSESDLPEEVQAERRSKRQQSEQAKATTKKAIKSKQRPQQVEATPVSGEKISLEAERYKQLNIALDGLREDFKMKLITKKQYQARQQILLNKFEKGGLT